MKEREEKFTTKKDDLQFIGKLTDKELVTFETTGELPDRIKEKISKK